MHTELFVGKPERKRPHGSYLQVENDISNLSHKDIGYVSWIILIWLRLGRNGTHMMKGTELLGLHQRRRAC